MRQYGMRTMVLKTSLSVLLIALLTVLWKLKLQIQMGMEILMCQELRIMLMIQHGGRTMVLKTSLSIRLITLFGRFTKFALSTQMGMEIWMCQELLGTMMRQHGMRTMEPTRQAGLSVRLILLVTSAFQSTLQIQTWMEILMWQELLLMIIRQHGMRTMVLKTSLSLRLILQMPKQCMLQIQMGMEPWMCQEVRMVNQHGLNHRWLRPQPSVVLV